MTGLETALITVVTGTFVGIVVKYSTGKNAVTVATFKEEMKTLKEDRKDKWSVHSQYCPENRGVLLKSTHDIDCARNLQPIRNEVSEIKEILREIQATQSKMPTMPELMGWLEAGMKK